MCIKFDCSECKISPEGEVVCNGRVDRFKSLVVVTAQLQS